MNTRALINGLVGACALTALHGYVRHTKPNAPRLDILGMRSIEKIAKAVGIETPKGEKLEKLALAGDIISNTIFFSQVGARPGIGAWLRGLNLGLFAGIGAITVPQKIGLDDELTKRTTVMALTTVGLYVMGGLAAAAVAQLAKRS